MKKYILAAVLMATFVGPMWGQDKKDNGAPTLDQTKVTALAKLQRDGANLQNQMLNLQQYAQGIQKQQADNQAQQDSLVADLTKDVDKSKWTFDRNSLTLTAVAAQEAPKAAPQPVKPASK